MSSIFDGILLDTTVSAYRHTKGGRTTTSEETLAERYFVFAWNDLRQRGGFNDLLGITPTLTEALDLIHEHTQNWGGATASVVQLSLVQVSETIVGTKEDGIWHFTEVENQIAACG